MEFLSDSTCCVDVKKSESEAIRYSELKAKKDLLEEKLLLKLEQLYELCLQEAVSTHCVLLFNDNGHHILKLPCDNKPTSHFI